MAGSDTDSDRAAVLLWDLDSGEELCECVGRLVSLVAVLEAELGKAYADEYRRGLASLILDLRVGEPSQAAWPGLRVSIAGTRRVLRQPTSAAPPASRRGRLPRPSAPG